MHRAACLLIALLAGCDQVWGLERGEEVDESDEDGDGFANSLDPCPHLDDQSQTDADEDGVPEACDSDDHEDQTVQVFFSFDSEILPSALEINGTASMDVPGTITFGRLVDGLDTITLKNVTAKTALIDVGFEILADTVEADPQTGTYAEIGLYTANLMYLGQTRGDVCFYGRLPGDTDDEALYTELVENEGLRNTNYSIGAFEGSTGRMRLARTPARYECSVYRTGNGVLGDANNVELLQSVDGRIGFSAERTQLRIRYIYIAYQPTIRL